MLMVQFKAWKNTHIFLGLLLLSLVAMMIAPQTQPSKNLYLYEAVVENNVTKAKIYIDKGADVELLLPKGFPLISVAIEYENSEMLKLLMLDKKGLSRTYKDGYTIIDHAASKSNKALLALLLEALER